MKNYLYNMMYYYLKYKSMKRIAKQDCIAKHTKIRIMLYYYLKYKSMKSIVKQDYKTSKYYYILAMKWQIFVINKNILEH